MRKDNIMDRHDRSTTFHPESHTDDGQAHQVVEAGGDSLWRLEDTDNFFGPDSAAANLTTGDYNTVGGVEAGGGLTNKSYNSVYGYQALYNGAGNSNVAVGYQAMYTATQSKNNSNNTMIGTLTGQLFEDGDYNVFLGSLAGQNAIQGDYNIAIGSNALDFLGDGGSDSSYNIGIGHKAGELVDAGLRNICIGQEAGSAISGGSYNIALGWRSLKGGGGDHNISIGDTTLFHTGDDNVVVGHFGFGISLGSGDGNTGLGDNCGVNLTGTASKNICVGFSAGPDTGSGIDISDRLYIDNSNGTPLISGDMNNRRVGINTAFPLSNILEVQETSATDPIADSWTTYPSDRRHKTLLGHPAGLLEKFMQIPTYRYKRKPLISDDEILHRGRMKARAELLKTGMPKKQTRMMDIDRLSDFMDVEGFRGDLVEEKAALPKYATERVGISVDDPEVPVEILSEYGENGDRGIDLLAYIGYQHQAIKELAERVMVLERG